MTKQWPMASALLLLAVLPLTGGFIRGFPEGFFDFPPLVTHPPHPAPFSAPVFAVFALLSLGAAGIVLFPRRAGFAPPLPAETRSPVRSRLPRRGWLGLGLLLASWAVAWRGLGLPALVRQHTFFPLWLGFIFFVDALVASRTGHSLYRDRRHDFWRMFPVSAVSWWYFEFLNRTVQNWWYPDRIDFGPVHYLIYSTLCFSTVIPAIFEARDALASFPALRLRYSRGPRLRIPHAAAAAFVLGAALLPLVSVFPGPLFFATWIAPLALLAGALELARVPTPFRPIAHGDWSPVFLLGLAALACGFCWELWNAFSSPRWAYAVPYVDRFHLFAMPAVGFSGYLPFGPVCACFWLAGSSTVRISSCVQDPA
ncbi:MAG: hypothetical protein GX548_05785 [Lentisphaerae bacterium]|nr:hypothetical protein [Lentisphaerota bacterium]